MEESQRDREAKNKEAKYRRYLRKLKKGERKNPDRESDQFMQRYKALTAGDNARKVTSGRLSVLQGLFLKGKTTELLRKPGAPLNTLNRARKEERLGSIINIGMKQVRQAKIGEAPSASGAEFAVRAVVEHGRRLRGATGNEVKQTLRLEDSDGEPSAASPVALPDYHHRPREPSSERQLTPTQGEDGGHQYTADADCEVDAETILSAIDDISEIACSESSNNNSAHLMEELLGYVDTFRLSKGLMPSWQQNVATTQQHSQQISSGPIATPARPTSISVPPHPTSDGSDVENEPSPVNFFMQPQELSCPQAANPKALLDTPDVQQKEAQDEFSCTEIQCPLDMAIPSVSQPWEGLSPHSDLLQVSPLYDDSNHDVEDTEDEGNRIWFRRMMF